MQRIAPEKIQKHLIERLRKTHERALRLDTRIKDLMAVIVALSVSCVILAGGLWWYAAQAGVCSR